MDDVAGEAEFSKRTIYVYFSSKEQIYFEIMIRGYRLLIGMIEKSFRESQPQSAIEELHCIFFTFFGFSQSYPAYFKAIMLLMFIGAAPGGTGGGVKITTVVVVAAAVGAFIKNQEDISIGRFRLERDTLFRAFCGMASYLALTVCGVLVLCAQGSTLTSASFECLSAIGTVGLTTGITPTLPPLSHLMLIILMYAGRIGSLTVFLAVSEASSRRKLKDPVGKIIVG